MPTVDSGASSGMIPAAFGWSRKFDRLLSGDSPLTSGRIEFCVCNHPANRISSDLANATCYNLDYLEYTAAGGNH